MTYPTVNCPGPITAAFPGKKYDVLISWDGVCGRIAAYLLFIIRT